MKKRAILGGFAGTCLLISAAVAAGLYTNGAQQATGALTGQELVPADTQLPQGQQPQTESISLGQMASYAGSTQALSGNLNNLLIGGDFGQNLFQRGTSFTGITNVTYTADRWFAWSSQAMQVQRDVAAGEVPTTFGASLQFGRTSATPAQVCVGQEIETVNAIHAQNATVEFDLHMQAGSGFSAASSQAQVYIVSGTGTDEGSVKMAYGVNGAGGGSSGWTGQANAYAGTIAITPTGTRYTAVATVPLAARELGVAVCYTPTGATVTNDYMVITGTQLARNASLSGQAGTGGASTGYQALIFGRRPTALEVLLQQRYYWQLTEAASSQTLYASCEATSATAGLCYMSTPMTMRAAPSAVTNVGSLKLNVAGTPTAVTALSGGTSSPNVLSIVTGVASGQTAGQAEMLQGGNAAGGGVLAANAEL